MLAPKTNFLIGISMMCFSSSIKITVLFILYGKQKVEKLYAQWFGSSNYRPAYLNMYLSIPWIY